MDLIISKAEKIAGTIAVPPSKSFGQRWLALSLLVDKMTIVNLGNSEDELAALSIVKQTGAKITQISPTEICIENQFDFNSYIDLNCGESGLSARLFSCLFMLNQAKTTIIGKGSLLSRPMNDLIEIFQFLGIDYKTSEKSLPISFHGKISSVDITINGSVSSQFITGLLYYLVGLKSKERLVLKIDNPTSIPYIQMTMDVLSHAGAEIDWFGDDTLLISPSDLQNEIHAIVESDWSSAAYFMVAAAIGGNIQLDGLKFDSLQADIAIWDVLEEYEAEVCVEENGISVCSAKHLPFEFDATHCPDLIPIISVLAVFAEGTSTIFGTQRLIYKESNRLNAIKSMLDELDIEYAEIENGIQIIGNPEIRQSTKEYRFITYNDHRMVMSAAILALFLHKSTIENMESVSKSYPNFFKDYSLIGGLC